MKKLNNKGFAQLLRIGILCNDASILEENGKLTILGDRTEGSLLVLAKEKGVDIKEYKGKGSAIEEFPFDSSLKRMSVVWSEGSKKEIYVKGAPEIIISRSTKILSDGKLTDLDTSEKKKLSKVVEDLAGNGFRLLGFGYKEFKGEPDKIGRDEVEKDLIFVGIVAIADPPRDEVKEAIKLAKNAGIKVVMITGDNPLTAKAIGAEIGLIEGNEKVIAGDKLEKMSQPELEETIKDIKIFARVTPEHKLRIVKAFQAKGSTVGVTGDGVNDAPALKQADVGLSMGIIGTDVAKEASDMVIADDNFASIIKAVEEGRVIYENILKSIRYLLACNAGELIAILGAVAIGFPSPLTPIQILWMNLVTDGLPALALAGDPKAHDTMNRPPRNKSVPILTILGKKFIITVGVILATATLVIFIVFLKFDELEKGRTLAFTILVLGQMVVAFLVRKGEKWNSNRLLLVAVLATVILQIIILITPALHSIFDVVPLI